MSSQPRQISHFEVLSELGRGGMGIVYKVKDTRNGAHAALKMIPPEALSRPDSALRFKREFRAMQRVEHPNVIRVYEAGTHEGCPFFTMELVDGREIRKFLDGDTAIVPSDKDGPQNTLFSADQRRRLNEPARVKKVADLVVQVAFALAEIHSHRIVHRDLKPDNILVSKAGVAKLMDFGIAKQLSANSEHSSGGMVVGTFKYLSPEQALGSDIDGRADLYCLGIILYELLIGRHPFYSENSVGYAFHHARKAPPDMEKFNPEVHQGLKAVCEKLIKKDPRDRYSTAEDVIAAIRAAVDDDQNLSASETSTRQRIQGPAPVKNLPYELAKDQLFHPAHVGRAAELKHLAAACERLRGGRGDVIVVSGRGGIGKSRLVREAAAAAKEARISFVTGKCVEHGAPYQPFVEIVESIIADHTGRTNEIARLLGDDGRVLARYVASLQNLDGLIRPKPAAALEPQGERVRFLQSMASFLGRASVQSPRVVVVDDVHLADELSLGLAQHLAENLARREHEPGGVRSPPIVLVFTFDPGHARAADAAALIARLSASSWAGGAATILALQPLPVADVKDVLASMLGGNEVGQQLVEYLHAESGGVPGAVEERVRAWHESGELRRSSSRAGGRQWVFVKNAVADAALGDMVAAPAVVEVRRATRWDIPVPDFAENPSEKRVGRLSPVARDVAERLAVVGEQTGGLLVERVALRTEDELLDALDELVKRSILADDKDNGVFRFVDADDRRALLAGLKKERAQQLHHFVARVLEDDARRHRRAANPEELSAHYVEAGEPLKAIEQMMVAARNALSASATQTAAQHVREAQELLATEQKAQEQRRTPAEASLVRIDLELVLLRLDVLAAVNEHKECVSLARRRLPKIGGVDGRLVAELLLRLAGSERLLGELDAALDHTAQVLSRTERGGAHALRCRAKSLCGQLYEQRGQFEVANRYFTDALELARTIGDELEEERARWALAARDLAVGNLDEATRAFEQLQQTATSRGEKLRVSQYVNALGVIAHERNQLDDAEAAFRQVIDCAKPAGDRRTLATALHHIAALRRDQGRFDDALALTAKAAKLLTDLDQVESLASVRVVEAQVILERGARSNNAGDALEALKKADEALDLGLKANSALTLAEAAVCRGLALCRSGDLAGQEDIDRGLQAARTLNANRPLLHGLLCRAECAHLAGDADAAGAAVDEGRRRARQTGFVRYERAFDAAVERLRIG